MMKETRLEDETFDKNNLKNDSIIE